MLSFWEFSIFRISGLFLSSPPFRCWALSHSRCCLPLPRCLLARLLNQSTPFQSPTCLLLLWRHYTLTSTVLSTVPSAPAWNPALSLSVEKCSYLGDSPVALCLMFLLLCVAICACVCLNTFFFFYIGDPVHKQTSLESLILAILKTGKTISTAHRNMI